MPADTPPSQRRPLKVRQTRWIARVANWLSRRSVTPNQISVASVLFALLAGAALLLARTSGDGVWLAPLAAALFIQGRLLCNLFDGMVAVEGGKGRPSGELFNDVPDRIADSLILIAAGYAAGGWAETAGWLAALLAVLTAYARVLALSLSAPADFRGPMAKPQRMALLTGACVLTCFDGLLWPPFAAIKLALALIVAGAAITLWRRLAAAYRYLERPQ